MWIAWRLVMVPTWRMCAPVFDGNRTYRRPFAAHSRFRTSTELADALFGLAAESVQKGSCSECVRHLAIKNAPEIATLGFPRFSVVGHDRGGRVAYRLALDHPDCIERLAVLDADEGGPLAIWRNWANDVRGAPLDAGRFFPEEIPEVTADALLDFFAPSVTLKARRADAL